MGVMIPSQFPALRFIQTNALCLCANADVGSSDVAAVRDAAHVLCHVDSSWGVGASAHGDLELHGSRSPAHCGALLKAVAPLLERMSGIKSLAFFGMCAEAHEVAKLLHLVSAGCELAMWNV